MCAVFKLWQIFSWSSPKSVFTQWDETFYPYLKYRRQSLQHMLLFKRPGGSAEASLDKHKEKQWGWCPLFLSGRAFPSSTMYRGQVNATANFNTMNRSHDSILTTKVRTPVCAFLLSLFFPRTQHAVCVQFSVLTRGATVNTPALPSSYGTHSHTSDHPNKQHEPNETGSKLWTRHQN